MTRNDQEGNYEEFRTNVYTSVKNVFAEKCVVFPPYIISWRLAEGAAAEFTWNLRTIHRRPRVKYLLKMHSIWTTLRLYGATPRMLVLPLQCELNLYTSTFPLTYFCITMLSKSLIRITVTFLLHVFLRMKEQTIYIFQQPFLTNQQTANVGSCRIWVLNCLC